ncbi:MAG: glycosyl hydrolase [Candidatus Acidiferrales bacterium]
MNIKCRLLRNSLLTAAMAMTTQFAAHAQQPWQKIQMPTAAEVASRWATPPPEYGPEPYYGFSGVMDVTVMRRDLDRMKALGFQSVTVQAGGRNMPEPYLSDAYFKLFQVFVEEAKQRDMRVWIVDDAGYPSGFAGGKFTQEKPDLRMQALVVAKKIPLAGGDTLSQAVTPATVAVLAVNSDGTSQAVPVTNGAVNWTAPPGTWTVLVVEHQFDTSPTRSETNPDPKHPKDTSQSLEDYLDPAATLQYLAFTHEQYKKYVGDEFGKTILGFRGDEPDYSISGIPWTPALFDRFQEIKGYDVRPYVASFFAPNMTDEQKRVKADYWDVFSIMFAAGFFKQQADWCAANGVAYQVHINHEEMEMELVRSEGDFFRDMRYVQVPGIDAIWHQIWMDTISDFPRLASSAAHLYGKARAFTETFAAYRPSPNVEQARYILNEEMVRGVNQIEVMYYPATSSGVPPPSALMGQPGFPDLMEYVRRLSYLMSMGKPGASVGLYIPSSSLWLNDAAGDRAFVSTERLLSEHQIDFDVVDENALAKELIPGKGTLATLSGNSYRTIILPGEVLLSQAALDRLRAFANTGGHVLFLDHTPSLIAGKTIRDARAATPADFSWATVETSAQLSATPTPPYAAPAAPPSPEVVPPAVLQAVLAAVPAPDLTLDTPDTALRYMKRQLKDAYVYFFFNESDHAVSHSVTLMGKGTKTEVWDPQTGAAQPMSSTRAKGSVKIELALKPYETRVVVVH